MASIHSALLALNGNLIRMFAKDPPEIAVPKISDILASWALPALAEAVARDMKDADARAEFERFRQLAERLKSHEQVNASDRRQD